jgi:hypothetical protein
MWMWWQRVGTVAVVLVAGAAAADEVYRMRDEQGRVHYSNSQLPGAEPLSVPGLETITPRVSPSPATAGDAQAASSETHAVEASPGAGGSDEAYVTSAAARRRGLERELRALRGRIRALDGRLDEQGRLRRRAAEHADITGGVVPAEVRSEEEKAIAGERETLAKQEQGLRADYDKLRVEVSERLGSRPAWWVDVR